MCKPEINDSTIRSYEDETETDTTDDGIHMDDIPDNGYDTANHEIDISNLPEKFTSVADLDA